ARLNHLRLRAHQTCLSCWSIIAYAVFPRHDSPIRRSYQISPLNDVPYATFEHIFLFVLGSTSGSSILTRFLFVTQLAE
ncbi:hypothetical protein B0H14DRAFT_3899571, partial [Mycena olivaceomarginata]